MIVLNDVRPSINDFGLPLEPERAEIFLLQRNGSAERKMRLAAINMRKDVPAPIDDIGSRQPAQPLEFQIDIDHTFVAANLGHRNCDGHVIKEPLEPIRLKSVGQAPRFEEVVNLGRLLFVSQDRILSLLGFSENHIDLG